MNTAQFLDTATKQLQETGVETAHLDCLVLLEDVTAKDRAYLLAHPDFPISTEQLSKLNKYITQRSSHIPLAQIRGKTEFYGRGFAVTKDVLEPRPESENMIDLLKKLALPAQPHIVDVGTGSGALGITVKLELPKAKVTLIEISPAALAIARQNAAKHGVEVAHLQTDLLTGIANAGDVILANLPYVPDDFHINPAAMAEPRLAIFGGKDGLNIYRRLFEQLYSLPQKPSFVLTESLPLQHETLAAVASSASFALVTTSGFIQLFVSK